MRQILTCVYCALLLLLFPAGYAQAQEQPPPRITKVCLGMGASNFGGQASAANLPPEYQGFPANLRLFYFTVPITSWEQRQTFGPELAFAVHYCLDHPEEDLIFIKCAWGGTSLGNWNPDAPGGIYKTAVHNVQAVLTSLNLPLSVDFILWAQGENDALTLRSALAYQANLIYFVKSLRRDLKSPRAAFVYALTGGPNPYWPAVVQGQKQAAAALEPAGYVETKGLSLLDQSPKIHFTGESLLEIGRRMHRRYLEVRD